MYSYGNPPATVTIESTPKNVDSWWTYKPTQSNKEKYDKLNSFVSMSNDAYPPAAMPMVKQEGINPMSYGIKNATCVAPTAIASITAESDDQKKIDYLNDRAQTVFYNIESTFSTMFHLHNVKKPRYYKDLIDAIKNDEYTINEKEAKRADEEWEEYQDGDGDYYDFNAFFGIDFTKFPKPDYAAYHAASKELRAEHQKVKDIIAIMPAEDALKAVQDFEKFKPSNAPTVQ